MAYACRNALREASFIKIVFEDTLFALYYRAGRWGMRWFSPRNAESPMLLVSACFVHSSYS